MKKTGIKKGKRISKIVCALMCMEMLLTGCGDSGSKKIMFKGEDSGQNTTEDSVFGGFGSDNNAGNDGTYTISEILESGDYQIWYEFELENDINGINKDADITDFFIIKDGKVATINSSDGLDLTLGDVAQMTDEELYQRIYSDMMTEYMSYIQSRLDSESEDIEILKDEIENNPVEAAENKKILDRKNQLLNLYQSIIDSNDFYYGNYVINVNTDASGNNVVSEDVYFTYLEYVNDYSELSVLNTTTGTVYDAEFFGIYTFDKDNSHEGYIVTRVNDRPLKLEWDEMSGDNIYVDKDWREMEAICEEINGLGENDAASEVDLDEPVSYSPENVVELTKQKCNAAGQTLATDYTSMAYFDMYYSTDLRTVANMYNWIKNEDDLANELATALGVISNQYYIEYAGIVNNPTVQDNETGDTIVLDGEFYDFRLYYIPN